MMHLDTNKKGIILNQKLKIKYQNDILNSKMFKNFDILTVILSFGL